MTPPGTSVRHRTHILANSQQQPKFDVERLGHLLNEEGLLCLVDHKSVRIRIPPALTQRVVFPQPNRKWVFQSYYQKNIYICYRSVTASFVQLTGFYRSTPRLGDDVKWQNGIDLDPDLDQINLVLLMPELY